MGLLAREEPCTEGLARLECVGAGCTGQPGPACPAAEPGSCEVEWPAEPLNARDRSVLQVAHAAGLYQTMQGLKTVVTEVQATGEAFEASIKLYK